MSFLRKVLLLACIALMLTGCDKPVENQLATEPSASQSATETTNVTEPTEPSVSLDPSLLVGSWTSVRREEDAMRASLLTNTVIFNGDGTGTVIDCEYVYYPDMPEGENGDGWSVAGRGYAPMYFNYKLEGNHLSVTYLGCLDEEWGAMDPYTKTYTIARLESNCLMIDDEFGTYLNGDKIALKDLCLALGVDYTVKVWSE